MIEAHIEIAQEFFHKFQFTVEICFANTGTGIDQKNNVHSLLFLFDFLHTFLEHFAERFDFCASGGDVDRRGVQYGTDRWYPRRTEHTRGLHINVIVDGDFCSMCGLQFKGIHNAVANK